MTKAVESTCPWCQKGVDSTALVCPHCNMRITVDTQKSEEEFSKPVIASRRKIVRETPFSTVRNENLVLGIDPGARFTGVLIRDGDVVVYSSILVRPKEMEPLPWALSVVEQIREIHSVYPHAHVAIEGIADPKGFHRGKRAPINPKDIMRAAAVAGGCQVAFPDAIIIPPGGNGSQDISQYPDCLIGRRPKDLPGSNTGAGTRSHEQSAFDVAGKAALLLWGDEQI